MNIMYCMQTNQKYAIYIHLLRLRIKMKPVDIEEYSPSSYLVDG